MPKLNNTKFGILLIKPTKKNTYIRKVTNWAFDNFKALCLVNKQNIVTHIATDAGHGVQQAQVLDEYLKRILGNKRVEKLKPTDSLRYWVVKEAIPLNPQYELNKPVRGIRYATYEEELNIEKIIVKSWFKQYNLTYHDVFWNTREYPKIYGSSMEFDFQEALFELEKSGELYL